MESRTYPRSKPAVHLTAVAFSLLLTAFSLTLCFLAIPAADSFAQILSSITVTPSNPTIANGQAQQFTATGTFSDGSTRVLTSGAGIWTTKAPMPAARYKPAGGVINGILYVVGGSASGNYDQNTVEAYDPVTDTWTTKAPMPTGREGAGVGIINNILYVLGGWNNGPLATVEAYDPATDTWVTKAPMSTARFGLGVGVVNGILYAIGYGYGTTTTTATVEAYDPVTNTWTPKSPMPTPRYRLAVGELDGLLYAVGGIWGESLSIVEAYDPATDTWITKPSMPTPRADLGVGVVNGVLYTIGGCVGITCSQYLSSVDAYDPVTNSWINATPMPIANSLFAVGAASGVIYTAGGIYQGGTPLTFSFTPPEVMWSSNNTAVATIDRNGLGTGHGVGTATITAISDSISGNTILTVVPAADLSITKTDTPDPVAAGSSLTYTITVTNNGPDGATGVTINDALPSGVTFISSTPTQGSCSGTSTVTCSLGTLANAATATVTIIVTAPTATGTISNTAVVSGNETDPNTANNSATESTVVGLPDLVETAITNPPASARVGSRFSVTDTVANSGTAASGSSTTRYYLSLDTAKSSGDKRLGGNRSVLALSVGETSTGTVFVTIPTNTTPATYYLLACADDGRVVTEISETNQCFASSTTVTVTP